MRADEEERTVTSTDSPICPHCKSAVPVPAFIGKRYECPHCKGLFCVEKRFLTVYKTEMCFHDDTTD